MYELETGVRKSDKSWRTREVDHSRGYGQASQIVRTAVRGSIKNGETDVGPELEVARRALDFGLWKRNIFGLYR